MKTYGDVHGQLDHALTDLINNMLDDFEDSVRAIAEAARSGNAFALVKSIQRAEFLVQVYGEGGEFWESQRAKWEEGS